MSSNTSQLHITCILPHSEIHITSVISWGPDPNYTNEQRWKMRDRKLGG